MSSLTGSRPEISWSFCHPSIKDAETIWRLAHDSGSLEPNPISFYLMWCRDFPSTSIVAKTKEGVGGFITGFTRPQEPETLFIWQAAVSPSLRSHRLARRMLHHLARPRFRFVEATVTPGNSASDRFLSGFACERGAELQRTALFGAELFPQGHEAEELYRIGPLPSPDSTRPTFTFG